MVARWLMILLMLSSNPVWAKEAFIEIELEENRVYLNDLVVLNVNSTGLLDDLSLQALDRLPAKRRETAGSFLRVHEGQLVEFTNHRIELKMTQAGKFVIGPLSAGNIESNQLTLEVLEGSPDRWHMPASHIQLETRLSPSHAYTQQMLVYEATLKHRYPLISDHFQPPDFEGFRVYPVIEEKRVWNDETDEWREVQWRYFLFPEISGAIEIAPFQASGEVIKSRWERAIFERKSDPIAVDVQPPPVQTRWWLPAHDLSIEESWSQEPPELVLGTPIQRQITLKASNVSAQQLPEVDIPDTRGLSIRLLREERQEALVQGQLQSQATFTYELRPVSANPVFLNTLRLEWWNTHKQQTEKALIPARRLDVSIPERQDLMDAYMQQLGWKERLKLHIGDVLPSGNKTMTALMALSSLACLVYLVPHRWSGKFGEKHSATRKRLLTAIKQQNLHRLYKAMRALPDSVKAQKEYRHLFAQIQNAAIGPDDPTREEWKQWRALVKTLAIPEQKSPLETSRLPPL